MVQVTVPPTLIVVTGEPLASSCHLKLDPFTLAVLGAVDVGVGDGDVAVAVGDGVEGVGVVVAVGVEFPFEGPLVWQAVIPRSRAIVTSPRAFIVSSFTGVYPVDGICWFPRCMWFH
jgi:hypothetical protein